MDLKEILKKVRQIEIKTRRLSKNIFAGEYHSSYKGRGMMFSEVREYQYGDDIRSIDWNVTARYNHPYVKIFEEERELTVMLLIDVSKSVLFGSTKSKKDYLAEIAAVLAFSAIQNQDKIGVILFSDKVEKFIPPKKGRKHILFIIRELLTYEASGTKTDLAQALQFFNNAVKKKSAAFIISDFIADDFEKEIKITAHKHDLAAFYVYDKMEIEMPKLGVVNAYDPETGKIMWINTNNAKIRKRNFEFWQNHQNNLKTLFNKANVDFVAFRTDKDYVAPLIQFFKSR